jgi:diguanylate cyclase (GGDEF)-like protein/PAS domain S-box-containing protein
MKPKKPPPPTDANEQIAALIQTLHQTGQRLEELTAGEVDAVADRDGRPFMLRHAQEHLRVSEAAKQAAILNALPAHIALLDMRGVIISVNAAWERFADANRIHAAGYGVGLNYLEICNRAQGDDASEAHQAAAGIRSVLDGAARSFSLEYPCHSPTEQRWFLMTVTPLRDEHPNGVVVMHLNIIERKRAEEALRESEARFRALTAMSSDFFWESDAEHRLTARASASKRLSMVSVFQRGAQIGERRWEIPNVSPDAAGWQAHRAVLDAHLPFRDFELSRLGVDGAERHISISGDPVFDESGAFQGYRGVGTDITERKNALEATRQLTERLTTTLESITDAFCTVDREWRFTFLNREAERLLERTRAELTGRDFWTEFPDTIGSTFEREYRRAMADNKTVEFEAFYPPLNIWFGVRAYPSAQGLAVYFRDITERKRAEEARKLREAELEESQRIARIGSWVWTPATGVITWSDGMNQVLARDRALPAPTFEALVQFYTPESWQRLGAAIARSIETGAPYDLELEMIRPDGATCWTTTRGEAIRGADGAVVKLRGTVHDITDRKAAEARITHLNRVYAVLSGINTLIVRVRDRDELFREACRIAVEAGGFRMSLIGIVDRSAMKIIPVASAGKDEALLTAIKGILSSTEDAPNTMVARALREKKAVVSNDSQSDPQVLFGKQYLESGVRSIAVLPLIVADEAVGVLALYSSEIEFFREEELKLLTELTGDIAFAIDHIDKRERLDYLAYYDALTGLANRSLFLDRVAQYMRSATSGGHKLALFLIDLERFKNINDSLGRPAGDDLLRQVAEWLTLNAGDANLLARMGADHFALVLPQVRQEGDIAGLLETTMAAFLDHPFRLNDAVFRISASVGAAVYPDDGADAETLLRNAEAALKKAKASGERYLFYTQKMTEAVAGKLTLENQLRQALDNEEFVLHYEPKVNLVSGKLTSAEALIRWNDPRTGLVPPGRFIPILEETGLINDVGRWALRKAIEDYLRWRAAGLPAVRIAVNVSPLQLRHRGFIDEIRQTIGIDAQAPAGLELEITESLIMADIKLSIASLQAIRALGVTIAIDDFGTGFSSLSYLAKLPVDTLKIDRSFVIEMTAGPEGLALVSTIINLAHSLKLKVVAEGVETEEQSRLLRLLGCDEMQGFLFSKPVPAEIFETRFLASPRI